MESDFQYSSHFSPAGCASQHACLAARTTHVSLAPCPSLLFLYSLQELRGDTRATLVDWLMEVCANFGLLRCTCHVAVSIVDRYLSATRNFPRRSLQLLGNEKTHFSPPMAE